MIIPDPDDQGKGYGSEATGESMKLLGRFLLGAGTLMVSVASVLFNKGIRLSA